MTTANGKLAEKITQELWDATILDRQHHFPSWIKKTARRITKAVLDENHNDSSNIRP